MRVDHVCVKKFGAHQTFSPRFGWLKKAFDGVSKNPQIFSDDDAPRHLGVGKNMVDSIAFWATAFRIISPLNEKSKSGAKLYEVTPFGRFIFDNERGVDQYLEDPNTLWLLHWNSLQAGCQLPVWWLSFNSFHAVEFSSEALQIFVVEQTTSSNWNFSNLKPIQKDVDCLLKMYSPRENQSRLTVDDFLDSPFRDLGLLTPSSLTSNGFRFEYGPKAGLSAEVALAICLDFIARTTPDARTVTVGRLVNDHGSPGRLLKLSEQALGDLLSNASGDFPDFISLTSPTGSMQLNAYKAPETLRELVLRSHYKLKSKGSMNAAGIGPMSFGDSSNPKTDLPKESKAATVIKRRISKKEKVLVK